MPTKFICLILLWRCTSAHSPPQINSGIHDGYCFITLFLVFSQSNWKVYEKHNEKISLLREYKSGLCKIRALSSKNYQEILFSICFVILLFTCFVCCKEENVTGMILLWDFEPYISHLKYWKKNQQKNFCRSLFNAINVNAHIVTLLPWKRWYLVWAKANVLQTTTNN